MKSLAIWVLAGTSLACREVPPPATGVPQWRLPAIPSLTIGVAEGEATHELTQATSSLRLADGRIIVANSGSQELRVFDREGRFLSAIGRKGQGPGEFDGSLQIRPAGADRFTVFDVNLQRLLTFDTAGRFITDLRVNANGTQMFPLSTWLYGTHWIDGPLDTLRRTEIAGVLDQLSTLPPGAYRFVKVADDGRLWVQVRTGADSTSRWDVLTPEAEYIATVEIPADLEIHQIGADFLIARHWESNDVEQIQLFQFTPSDLGHGQPAASRHPGDSADNRSAQVEKELANEVRNLVTAQEGYYADHGQYATQASALTSWQSRQGMQLHLMAADRRGWVGLIVSRLAPQLCAMAVGGSTPPGWMEGSPKCSR